MNEVKDETGTHASGLTHISYGGVMLCTLGYATGHTVPIVADPKDVTCPGCLLRTEKFTSAQHLPTHAHGITTLVRDAFGRAERKGWWDRHASGDLAPFNVPEKLALIHSEVSEALEDYREGRMRTTMNANGKPIGFPSELADIVIRVADLCGALGIDLEHELFIKALYNETRAHRHGGKKC